MTTPLHPDLRELLDKEAIKELLYRHTYHKDAGGGRHREDYTDDITIDIGPLGRAEGLDAVLELVDEPRWDGLVFLRPMLHNPVIEVDGDEATGTWYAEAPSIIDGEVVWIQGTYEYAFRRVDGDWKIAAFTFEFAYATPFDAGWVAEPFVEQIPDSPDW